MDKIYIKDNYIVTELGGITAVFPKNYCVYSENAQGFNLNMSFPTNNQKAVFIDFTRVTSIYNEAGTVAYSIATLRSFLLLNTGFKSPSGGSGGSTITVGTTPITSGVDGRVLFQSGGVVQQDSSLFWDNTNKRLGVGATPSTSVRLDVRAQGALSTDIAFRVRNSADTRNFLVVNGAGDVFNNGAGGVTSNTFYGENSGRSAIGINNVFFGSSAGQNNITGQNNSFIGERSAQNNINGIDNSFFGQVSGLNNINGNANCFFGVASGFNNTSGSNNVAIGRNAGRFISTAANLTIANNSVFIGFDTRANANSETNQIVIGHNAIGTGSNSVTLGNTSITRTNLRGQVVISGFASAPTGVEGAIYYDSTTKKHYGFDGTTWNALY